LAIEADEGVILELVCRRRLWYRFGLAAVTAVPGVVCRRELEISTTLEVGTTLAVRPVAQ
jgi:hypothetical protein